MSSIRIPTFVDVKAHAPARRNPGQSPSIRLEATVSDTVLREELTGRRNANDVHDGFEKPFALVPRRDADGSIQWNRIDLPFQGSNPAMISRTNQVTIDQYGLDVPVKNLDLNAVYDAGIAFGMTTRGTDGQERVLWFQDENKNFIPES